MEASAQRWIVKDVRGRIFGPFTTERMFTLIKRSVFVGDEQIAIYPEGSFKEISKVPEFYDLLLEALSKEQRALTEEERRNELTKGMPTERQEKENKSEHKEQVHQKTPSNRVVKETRESPKAHTKPEAPSPIVTRPTSGDINPPDVIDLQTQESVSNDESKRKIFIAILVLLVGATAYMFLEDETSVTSAPSGQIELMYPKQKRESLAEPEARNQLGQALQLFQLDSFSNYFRSMNMLVGLIESGYANVDAMSLLCLTYRELWPYANQDSKDLMALSKMAQMSSQKDPVGVSGSTCRVVQYLLGGQADGATSLTDTTLNNHPSAAAFYEFKSSLLAGRGDNLTAIAYLEKAQQLWPKWQKLNVTKAQLLTKESRQNEAAQIYRDVLKQSPAHAVGMINLGELEYFFFKHLQGGVELTKTGLETDRAPRSIMSKGYTLLAVQAERDQNSKDAIEYAGKAFSYDPTNLSAKEILKRLGGQEQLKNVAADRELVALGEEYIKKGNYFAAQAEFKTAFEMNPQNGRAAMLAAQSLWELNQSTEAIDWAKKAIQADKTLVQAYILLADYYSQRFDFKSAAQMLQTAQKIAPQSYQVPSGYALVELRRYNYKGAIEMAKRALKLYDTDIETYRTLVSGCLGTGDYNCAYESAAKALNLDGNNKKVQALYAEVLASYQGVDAGVEYLKNLINTYPQQIEYRIAMGKVLLKDDRHAEAIEVLNQALALNEKSKQAYVLIGKAQEKAGDPRSALKSYLSAAALDPADVGPTFMAAELYTKLNDFQKASAQFQQVVKINQLYPRAHYQLGKTALLMGDADRAYQEAMLEKRINPALPDGYILAGDAFMAKRDYSKAAGEYQRANTIFPQAGTYVLQARAYRLLENYNVASSLLNKAKSLEDGNPDIYKEQGAIFEGRGEKSEAVLAYQKYLQLLPNAADRQVIESRINGLGGP